MKYDTYFQFISGPNGQDFDWDDVKLICKIEMILCKFASKNSDIKIKAFVVCIEETEKYKSRILGYKSQLIEVENRNVPHALVEMQLNSLTGILEFINRCEIARNVLISD